MSDAQREIENLRRILDVSRRMAVTIDLDALLSTIIEATCEVLDCERATVFLYDAAADQLFSRIAKDADEIRFPADRGIAGAAAHKRVVVNVPDAYADERFNPDVDKKTGYRTRNLLTFPLENIQGDLIGVLQALNKHAGVFGEEDEGLARVLSAQAGVAIDRARLLEEFAEKQRMARDLDIAREIQQAQFPKRDPEIPGYTIAGWNRPADETGGDCYDFIALPDGRLVILLADATGHGIGPALVIAECRALLRAMLSVTDDLRRIAAGVNNLLAEDLSDERFVTAFIGILDPAAQRIDYLAGGQGPVVLVTPHGAQHRNATDLPFAVLADHGFSDVARFDLPPGGTLVLLTDGFYEMTNSRGDQFGEERVIEFVQQHGTLPLTTMIEQLYAAVSAFSDGQPQPDDLTAVLIRRNA